MKYIVIDSRSLSAKAFKTIKEARKERDHLNSDHPGGLESEAYIVTIENYLASIEEQHDLRQTENIAHTGELVEIK